VNLRPYSVYYTYTGSTTSPPCATPTTWIVLPARALLSQAQIDVFRGVVVPDGVPDSTPGPVGPNTRPLQSMGARSVRRFEPALTCIMSQWSAWSGCLQICGQGTRRRTRSVVRPGSGGIGCQGTSTAESQACAIPDASACAFAEWSLWTGCTLACGQGSVTVGGAARGGRGTHTHSHPCAHTHVLTHTHTGDRIRYREAVVNNATNTCGPLFEREVCTEAACEVWNITCTFHAHKFRRVPISTTPPLLSG
jgi:hypothetical protein